jgi:hypothetical protein
MSEDDISKAVKLIAELGAPAPFSWKDLPRFREDLIECVCGTWKPLAEMETLDTGVVAAYSNVCRGCVAAVKHDRELARVVCVGCLRVVARLAPHKDKAGFEYAANRTYHILKCGHCEPGLEESHILEKVLHDRSLGRKSN